MCCWNCKNAVQDEENLYNVICVPEGVKHDENYYCEKHDPVDEKTEEHRLNTLIW